IETVGTVRSASLAAAGGVVSIDIAALAEDTALGDSIAVNGVCLTVTKLAGTVANFDVSAETVAKSSLSNIRSGSSVNLERAMSAQGRFGGHIVQGHVDGVAKVEAVERKGDFVEMRFAAGEDLLDNIIAKGSVAVDGVSLTVAKINARSFTVAVIPVTLKETTLGKARPADIVNIETDIICKTVKKQLERMLSSEGGLTVNKLRELGF
ncbi:MAG: riboflavin synthase, partial [Planctomycetes bacterium]|nr:riboflavin synthase [Planctomycetota bacterium]